MFRIFELSVDISGQVLGASYAYRDGKLASFQLTSLPPRWMARQRASSKTLVDPLGIVELCHRPLHE
jgi:hypothetical protein